MMKNECPIVKDLMPLYIDGAVCDDSREFMADHIAHCPACAEVYGEMRTEFRFRNAQQEKAAQAELEKAALRVKKRRARRRALLATACLVLGAALCLAGVEWYGDYYYSYSQAMTSEEYDFTVYKSLSGLAVGVFDLEEETLACVPEVSYVTLEDGMVQVDVALKTTRRRAYVEADEVVRENAERTVRIGEWRGGTWYVEDKPVASVVVKYGDGEKTVYEANRYVRVCSEEMRIYYRFADSNAEAEGMGMQGYLKELLRLRDQVPEWQGEE